MEPWQTQRVFVPLLYPPRTWAASLEGSSGCSPMEGRWVCCLQPDSSLFYPWEDTFYVSLSSGQGKPLSINIYNDCFEIHRPTNLKVTIYTLVSGFALFELNRMPKILCKFTRRRMAGICAPMLCICSRWWGHVRPEGEGFLPHSTHCFGICLWIRLLHCCLTGG